MRQDPMPVFSFEMDFHKLADKLIKNTSHRIYEKDFREQFVKKGVYVWIYKNRVIYIGTAFGAKGFLGRNTEHIRNLLRGKGTFIIPNSGDEDIYNYFIGDEEFDLPPKKRSNC